MDQVPTSSKKGNLLATLDATDDCTTIGNVLHCIRCSWKIDWVLHSKNFLEKCSKHFKRKQ